MLRISKISKVYRTGALTQRALDGVSLSLRDSEFVAILGPSGSGKTTLLNIIGGLDRYDSGDLIINGVSTKKYTDRDWDSYRNHTVGFVFQSYNLIPHQTILENVELALTIGGAGARNKSERAREALRRVGLGEHIHKKPNQLSGGQMQRVAIARALVNDPDILLADEPTGALDSDTSVQVMELLKEVAKDRLVVMVTHNPELAEQYATRIVTLRDGVIRSDTDPFEDETDESEAVHKNLGKASMSFLTALRLSFNNLRTKLARTILVSFAGSIGIIGIAMILAMSNGVDLYIQNIEEDTLQSYPIQITNTSFDISGMVASRTDAGDDDEGAEKNTSKAVRERHTITSMLSGVTTNDLESLKNFLESDGRSINSFVRAIEYDYGVTPQIYTLRDGKVRQVNPDKSFASLGFNVGGYGSSLMSSFTSTDTFHLMPEDNSLYLTSYDIKAGHWPENYDECVLVLSGSSRVTDMALYTMGLKNPARLDEMLRLAANGGTPETDISELQFDYEDFLGISFRLIAASERYSYDEEYGVWTDRSEDESFMSELLEGAEEISIVGVAIPREDASNLALSSGIGYLPSLVYHMIERANASEPVLSQQENPELDIFTGKEFGADNAGADFDMSSLFSVDEDALADAFSFDPEDFEIDPGEFDISEMEFDPDAFSLDMPSISESDISSLFGGIKVNLTPERLGAVFEELLKSYGESAGEDGVTELAELPAAIRTYLGTEGAREIISADAREAIETARENFVTIEDLRESLRTVMSGLEDYISEAAEDAGGLRGVAEYLSEDEVEELIRSEALRLSDKAASALDLNALAAALTTHLVEGYEEYSVENEDAPTISDVTEDLRNYLSSDEAQRIIGEGVAGIIDTSGVEAQINRLIGRFSGSIESQMTSIFGTLAGMITEKFSEVIGDIFADFSIDPEAISAAFSTNFSGEELKSLMMSMMNTERSSYDSNLRKLGFADLNRPTSITIYPTDFDGKSAVKGILTGYNDMRRAQNETDKVISYTDYVDTLMSGVTDIIDAVSYVLVAFVSISLVVSSIMIGVITYISVLERKKEIGILRAIGASKRNISEVFNAETFIIGALAGLFGVVITWILIIPTNIIIHEATGQMTINAVLPIPAAAVLVVLSIVLTLIGGIIPSQKAARSDPVTALRSE